MKKTIWISSVIVLSGFILITNGCKEKDKTFSLPPSVTTSDATNIEDKNATLNGFVNANNSSTLVSFEYGTTTSYGYVVEATPDYIDGSNYTSISKEISGLISCQTYHFRIKAINSNGEIYGNDLTFTTKVKDIDGNLYDIIKIGTQTWISENLKTTKFNDGTSILLVTNSSSWAGLTTPGYCWYNNDASTYKDTYGALYNRYTVASENVCPIGWHASTYEEWELLTTYLGGYSIAGAKLKEVGTTHWSNPNTGATNESGFTALPGGMRSYVDGSFSLIQNNGFYWTPSVIITVHGGESVAYSLSYNNSVLSGIVSLYGQTNGYSIRCVKNN
jgi:uncharacterized protein (TIGR02145 family)